PLDEQRQLDRARSDKLGVELGESRLQAGRTHRCLLEWDLLLVTGVTRMVGCDAVDRARAEAFDQREPVSLAGERWVHLHARVQAAHVLVAQEQMMRSDLGAHPKAALLGGGNSAHRSGTAQVLEVHTA